MNKKSIAKNYIYNLIYQIIIIILPLITTPYLSRVLGAEKIGIYGYTVSIVTYFILFGSLGISMYGQREIAYVQNDKEKQSIVFWEIIILRFITLLISMIIFYFTFAFKGDYSLYYKILLLELFANMIDISWYFQGIEEFKKTVLRNIVVRVLSVIAIFIFIKTPEDLWKYFILYVCADVLGNLSLWKYIPKYINKVKISNLKVVKHIKPTISLFIPQVAMQIYTVLDKTMIGSILGNMTEVGYYEQSQKIVKTVLTIITSLGTVMSSRIASIYVSDKKEEINSYLKKSFNFVWFLGIPMMFGLIAIAKGIVPWFYGSGYDEVVPLIIILSPILLAIGLSNVTGTQYLVPIGKQKEFTISVTVGAIVNVILNFVLIKILNAKGAAIASVISEVFVFFIQFGFLRKELKLKDVFGTMYKYLISGIFMFVLIEILSMNMNPSIINTFIQVIVGSFIYFIMLLILRDKFIMELINKFIKRRRNL